MTPVSSTINVDIINEETPDAGVTVEDVLHKDGDITATGNISGNNLSGTNTGDQDLSGLVPNTTTVNGHALNSDVSVTASDVGLGNVQNVDTTNAGNINSGVLGSSYGGAGSVSGILKADGSGTISQAVDGTDYLSPSGNGANLTGLTKTQVGLANTDNTSDANKPVSTATQTALNAKQDVITGAATTIVSNNLTANKVLLSDNNGKVSVSSVTNTLLGYLANVTSDIQTQINNIISGAPKPFKYGYYTLSANQTSNLAVGNHVEWNTATGSLGGLSTGSGQANGIITLPANKTYKISFGVRAGFTAGGSFTVKTWNRSSSTYVGKEVCGISPDATLLASQMTSSSCVLAVGGSDITIETRIEANASLTSFYTGYSWLLIEEYAGY